MLSDEPQSGAPATFTPEQICQIVALSSKPVDDFWLGVLDAVGFTLRMMRDEVWAAVSACRGRGDRNIHYVDGLSVLGPESVHLMPDELHPNAEGYRLMGRRFAKILADILAR